jgi:Flp pilus assembly pilin Flp
VGGKDDAVIKWIRDRFARADDQGQGVVEYGLALAMVAVVVLASVSNSGTTINSLLQKVASSLSTIS